MLATYNSIHGRTNSRTAITFHETRWGLLVSVVTTRPEVGKNRVSWCSRILGVRSPVPTLPRHFSERDKYEMAQLSSLQHSRDHISEMYIVMNKLFSKASENYLSIQVPESGGGTSAASPPAKFIYQNLF